MASLPTKLVKHASSVRLVVLDVDGILTDGQLRYGPNGELFKTFNVKDGLGIKLLQQEGISVAVISARSAKALERRLSDLRVEHVYMGCHNKLQALHELRNRLNIPLEQIAFAGDDLIDLPVLQVVGLPVTVRDAHPQVIEAAAWVTDRAGGAGAVREIADAILKAKGILNGATARLLEQKSDTRFRIVIPARFGSSRLEGKPLSDIAGKPMVVHVWEKAMHAGAHEVVVATDDERIQKVVEDAGGQAVMTSVDHRSGTDRIAEVAAAWDGSDIVVNLQGDEPLVPGAMLADLAGALAKRPAAGIATMSTPIERVEDVFNPNIVKVVADDQGYALYFSRAPIPWVRESFADTTRELPENVPFSRHLGLYAYRVATLRRLTQTPPSGIERAESLEQLRALSIGIPIYVQHVANAPAHGVDTEEDLARVRSILG